MKEAIRFANGSRIESSGDTGMRGLNTNHMIVDVEPIKAVAGPDMDMAIATLVMGRTLVWFDRSLNNWRSNEWSQCGPFDSPEKCKHPVAYYREPNGQMLVEVSAFKPSMKIESAWTVVEKLKAEGFSVHWLQNPDQSDKQSKEWIVGFAAPDRMVYDCEADTAMLGICIAALRAKGIEVLVESV